MILANCDGGSRGNPGPAAIGVVIWTENRKILEEVGEYIGVTSNNVAEYKSLIKALTLAKKHDDELTVYMDSQLVVRQMTGQYRVKAAHLVPLHSQAKKLASGFSKITFSSLPREDPHQSRADMLVNKALDERR